MTRRAFLIRDPFWWSDGVTVLPVDPPTLAAYLERGVSRGYVVAAPTAEHARRWAENILANNLDDHARHA